MTPPGRAARERRQDDEDAAVVLTIVAALAASATESAAATNATGPSSFWGDPAHRLGITRPSATGWWASGMPR